AIGIGLAVGAFAAGLGVVVAFLPSQGPPAPEATTNGAADPPPALVQPPSHVEPPDDAGAPERDRQAAEPSPTFDEHEPPRSVDARESAAIDERTPSRAVDERAPAGRSPSPTRATKRQRDPFRIADVEDPFADSL
ncbi:MAG: hypothetical protein KF901_33385, partial [Myxococcales bacterium]|nr:hypothetical protein [Myxococcales bacterium]